MKVKIWSKVLPLEIRERLVNEGFCKPSNGKEYNICDGHNVKDILNTFKRVAEEDPETLNNIREEIMPIFKSTDYFLLEGRRAMFGIEPYVGQIPLWIMDISEPFFQTIEEFVKEGKTDLDEWELRLNENIKKTEEYQELFDTLFFMGVKLPLSIMI